MKLIKKFLSIFLIYKILSFIESLYYYNKDYNLISDVFYGDEFKNTIKKYLKCDLSKDWIGRLYGVINPNIDINGNLDVSGIIIELDGNQTNNIEYVRNWIYRQMQLVGSIFRIEKLYTYIKLDITHVGPKNHDNYLVVFDMISRKYMATCFKKMMKHISFYGIIAIILYIMNYYNFMN